MINRINLYEESLGLPFAGRSAHEKDIPMTAIQKLTRRLRSFPEKEQEKLATLLLSELDALGWDRQIEADVIAGKLDTQIEQAKQSHRSGRTKSIGQ